MTSNQEPEISSYLTTIPNALAELKKSHSNINQIAVYCKSSYANDPDPNSVYIKTQNYIKDALANVAYHIQNVGQQVNNFLLLQSKEIQKIDIQVQSVTDRLKVAHDTTGATAFTAQDSVRTYQKRPKLAKLAETEIPLNSRPQPKFVRTPINLRILDAVGTDLQGNRGKDSYKIIPDSAFQNLNEKIQSTKSIPLMTPPQFSGFNQQTTPPPLSAPSWETPPPMNSPPPFNIPPGLNVPSNEVYFDSELPPPPPPF
jgi:hypothetical protein